ncbi:hypothetical protein A2U01_0021034 [Trifolium medium]|uniref:Uncharacterized protein n=1 Tax=Trifolium medium TaxID=97028 RepID=A0A392NLB7_9FABA|nr:hypothetical protein [Trifolium medium]
MVEASGMRMMMMFTNTTTVIPAFNPTIHRTESAIDKVDVGERGLAYWSKIRTIYM